MDKKLIRDAYKSYWLENGKRPVSIYTFCQQLGIAETAFYDLYSSFDAVEKDLWLSYFKETVEKLSEDEIYRNYSAQEKLLTFYFMWVQKLKENRSYILQQKENYRIPGIHLDKLETFRIAFYDYIRDIVKEGYTSNEIKERKFISDQYVHGFWMQALFVLRYWTKDDSNQFEMTDAAIEKAVNLSFQLISSNTLDSLVDFGKFMFTRK
jgi:hypothetical protein